MRVRLDKSITSTERSQAADTHCDLSFLYNSQVFQESLQNKAGWGGGGRDTTTVGSLQYSYHCLPEEEVMVVWRTRHTVPSGSAGAASDTYNSKEACQEKLSNGSSK